MASIRRAAASDAEAVADLFLRSRESSVPLNPPMVEPPKARAWLAGRVKADGEVWLAEAAEAGEPVAAFMLLDGEWVSQLHVHPALLRQGIGSQLIDLAKRLRPGGLQLWTFQSNVPAHRFYEWHGFVAVERTDGSGNIERAPDVRYAWRPAVTAPAES